MFILSNVFSSNALYQADSTLRIHGSAAPNSTIILQLLSNDNSTILKESTDSDNNGRFSIDFITPSASFDEYTISLTDNDSEYIMEHVLFGELWLASGQSNMELSNNDHRNFYKLFELMQNKKIRIYSAYRSKFYREKMVPWDPDENVPGEWLLPDSQEKLLWASAIAYRFSGILYDFLNQNQNVPVGFLNASNGGTPIASWIPRDEVEADASISATMKKLGCFPSKDDWNTKGDENGNQTSAMYNVKIATLEGVRVRGILWYQGENDTSDEYERRCYAEYLQFYYKVYSKRFAADPARFLMISVLIYPWTYDDSGDCHVGYINQVFIDAAINAPDKFAYIPSADMEPVWNFTNHPVHPVHKYELGERLALLAKRAVYHENGQQRPAILDHYTVNKEKVQLFFRDVGSGLRVDNVEQSKSLRGMYIAGDDGVYLPAEYEINSPDSMTVWADSITEPKHVAYSVQSFEVKVNLYAGDYPVTPFFTDHEHFLTIEQRPWYDTSRTSQWVSKYHDNIKDVFYHPVFRPGEQTEICPDTAFKYQSDASLRVSTDNESAEFFICSYRYYQLDLQKFSGIALSIYNMEDVTASIRICGDDFSLEYPLEIVQDEGWRWGRYEAHFNNLPDSEVREIHFIFRFAKPEYRFVNVERIRLIK